MRWEKKKLSEISIIDWGNTSLTKESYKEDGAYIAVSAAGADGRIGHYEHDENVLVVSAIGANCGRLFFPGRRFTAIKNTITITPNSQVDAKFLFYYLSKNEFKRRGAGQPFISKGDTEEMVISLPPMALQRQIADTLDKADALRQKDQQLLQKYDELGLSLFHEMFDESTKRVALSDITTKITDGVHHKPEYLSKGVPFISVKNVTKRFLDFGDCKFVSQEAHRQMIKRCNPEFGDILYTKVGATYGRAAVVDTHEEFSLFVSVSLIKPDRSKILSEFLQFVMNSDTVKTQADRSVKGAGVPDLHLVEIKKFLVPLPTFDEQIVFCSRIKAINELKKRVSDSKSSILFNSLQNKFFA